MKIPHTVRLKALLVLLMTLTLSGYSASGLSQTDKEAESASKTADEDSQKTTKAPASNTSSTSSGGDFTPSEEVSEDLSVAFPVDI